MTDLERLELIIRRLHSKRAHEFESGGCSSFDMGCQKLLWELADALADAISPPDMKASKR